MEDVMRRAPCREHRMENAIWRTPLECSRDDKRESRRRSLKRRRESCGFKLPGHAGGAIVGVSRGRSRNSVDFEIGACGRDFGTGGQSVDLAIDGQVGADVIGVKALELAFVDDALSEFEHDFFVGDGLRRKVKGAEGCEGEEDG